MTLRLEVLTLESVLRVLQSSSGGGFPEVAWAKCMGCGPAWTAGDGVCGVDLWGDVMRGDDLLGARFAGAVRS